MEFTAGVIRRKSVGSDRFNQTLEVPCGLKIRHLHFPGDRESQLHVLFRPRSRNKIQDICFGDINVPKHKFAVVRVQPFISGSCEHISSSVLVKFRHSLKMTELNLCGKLKLLYANRNFVSFRFFLRMTDAHFRVLFVITALKKDVTKLLDKTCQTKFSGTVTPYGFTGFTLYPSLLSSSVYIHIPIGHSVMYSYPHFHIHVDDGCSKDRLKLMKMFFLVWTRCGTLQLPPKVYESQRNKPLGSMSFTFETSMTTGYTGFKIRFSYHDGPHLPQRLLTNDASSVSFNCSVAFYAKFREHLDCNLETECLRSEDEMSCPYSLGACDPGFLNAGSKCYKYVRTRKTMTWYDASEVCREQGLVLASFSTLKQQKAFRDNILRFGPTPFKVIVGLRTSDASLPAIYREVWRWSSGTMAFYIHAEEQVFKPMCASFAALTRDISPTMCGSYEHVQYIFCEQDKYAVLDKVTLMPIVVSSTFGLENNTRFVKCSQGHMMHNFLSCEHSSRCGSDLDLKSCVTNSSVKSQTAAKRLEILMYVCDSQSQAIHYSQVCDYQAQCFDSSDESFCSHQACPEKQCQNQKCVTEAQWCDGMAHCSDGSDEDCHQFVTRSAKPANPSTSGFHVVVFDGFGKYKYVPQGDEFSDCPSTHFLCANHELCLPVYLRCNGVPDCSDHEDEGHCDDVTCPGYYRCLGAAVCVHSDHVCDGVFQCPQQDDELFCYLTCPDHCLCQGLAFVCPRPFPIKAYSDLRYLDSSHSGLYPDRIFHNHYLVSLSLSRCRLHTLPVLEFPNLKYLDLGHNGFLNISMNVLLKLSNLNFLSLSGNPITKMTAPLSKTVLVSFKSLDLSYTKLKYFESAMFNSIRNLQKLNLSHGQLKVVGDNGFGSLTKIEFLDLRGTELKYYPVKMLQSLSSLRIMFSDIYKLCCQDILPEQLNIQNCHTSPDEIASCKDLLRSDVYRMFLWISCLTAVIGNAGSFGARYIFRKGKPLNSFNILIANLNVADFFMGLYLVIIGSADQVYRGVYLWHDRGWKTSSCCKTAGFFSLLSCETSAFVICLITLDRLLVTRFPFSQLRFRNASAHLVCGLFWLVGVAIAVYPLLPATSQWEFYGQTDICIPLPITRRKFRGHIYSFGILIVFNFLLFVFIALGQLFIYMSIRVNSMAMENTKARETTVARRLFTVIVSNFLCWFPIGLLGLMASSGASIPGEVNAAMAVFVLPLNSALNPFLYTFNLVMEKRQKAAEQRLLKKLQTIYCKT